MIPIVEALIFLLTGICYSGHMHPRQVFRSASSSVYLLAAGICFLYFFNHFSDTGRLINLYAYFWLGIWGYFISYKHQSEAF